MRKRPLIYLAGAIDNISKVDAQQWREEATEVLSKLGCDVYNPLLGVMGVGSPEETIQQNQEALRASDAVLAELWKPTLHYGTVTELEEAVSLNIPVVAWMEGVRPPLYLRRHAAVIIESTKFNALHAVARAAKERLKPMQDAI